MLLEDRQFHRCQGRLSRLEMKNPASAMNADRKIRFTVVRISEESPRQCDTPTTMSLEDGLRLSSAEMGCL